MESTVYQEYKTSVHFKSRSGVHPVCADCHAPHGDWIALVMHQIIKTKELFYHLMGKLDTPEKFEAHRRELAETVWAEMKANDSRECRHCHVVANWDLNVQRPRSRAQHADMAKTGETCIDCHKGIAHKAVHEEEKDEDEDSFELSAVVPAVARIVDYAADADSYVADKADADEAKYEASYSVIDWSGVEGKDVTLFYPGQASWEWVLTKSNHSGAQKFREGKNCRGCHEGEQADMGALIVSGKKLEPTPIAGKRGSIPLNVKMAHDDKNLYVHLQWKPQDLGGAQMDPEHAAKVTMIMDDGTVVEATRAGCWGACHDDATGMASSQPGEELHKYLARSRTKITRHGGGKNYKPDAEIAQMEASGQFLEYWQARLNPGAPASTVNGYILKARHETTPTEVSATADFKNGAWSVVLSRALKPQDAHHKVIESGKTYSVGFAIHDAHAAGRFHHVSFGYTFALDQGDADFVALQR